MSRPLRIEYPGAWYHVMNRGRRFEKIFSDRQDYQVFVELLKDSSEMWKVKIAAYCLMSNHYHMLLQTPEGNIARFMRHINGVYTQRYNRKHGCDGQLFRGRYKSILVNGDSYLLQLVRYIHRNPVKSGLADSLNGYEWSSHQGYLSVAKKWDWLYKTFIYSLLTGNKRAWIKSYRQFVFIEDEDTVGGVIEGEKWPSVLGPKSFVDWVKGKYYESKADEEIPQTKELTPGRDLILRVVRDYYEIPENDLYNSKRGVRNEARDVAVYLIRRCRRESLKEIGNLFEMEKYSSVSSIIERFKKQLRVDRSLKKRVDECYLMVKKSQEQT